MRFDLTVNEFTMKMVSEKRLVVYGERFWRPYVHVRDAARAICTVLESPERAHGQVYNVGSTAENFRKSDLVEMIRVHVPDAHIEHVERPEDPRDYRVCFAKISRDLGYSITKTVQAGISEVARLVQSGAMQSFDDPIFRN
jgi:nucleoside-diphosphate-sugar epimerase